MRCTLPSPLWFPTPFLSGLFFFHKTLLPLPSSYLKLKVRTQARFEVLQYNNQSGQFLLIRLCLLPLRMRPLLMPKLISSFLLPFYSPIRAWHRLASQALNDSTWIRRLPPRFPIFIDGKSKSCAHSRITASGTLASSAASATVIHILFMTTP